MEGIQLIFWASALLSQMINEKPSLEESIKVIKEKISSLNVPSYRTQQGTTYKMKAGKLNE